MAPCSWAAASTRHHGEFRFHVLNQAGQVLQSDVGQRLRRQVLGEAERRRRFIAAGGGWLTSTYTGQLRAISVRMAARLGNRRAPANTIAMSTDGTILAAGCGATYSGSASRSTSQLANNVYQLLTVDVPNSV